MLTHKEKLEAIRKSFRDNSPTFSHEAVNVLFEEISLLEAEVERLRADSRALAALREAARPILRMVDSAKRIDHPGNSYVDIVLSQREADALRDALADRMALSPEAARKLAQALEYAAGVAEAGRVNGNTN